MPRTNVALIGFMGAGKSTVGRALAARMGKAFVETDALVEERAGMSVAEVFATRGEAVFRDLEAAAVCEAAGRQSCVIACGGGVVLRDENVMALRRSSVLVYLEVSPEAVVRRLGPRSTVRPLLSGPDRARRVNELLQARRPVYESVADITVKVDELSVDGVAAEIQKRLKLS